MLLDEGRFRGVALALVAVGVIVVVGVAVPGLVGTAGASNHGIDSCTEITQPGTYEITSDIRNASNDPCLEIEASDVTIEGNGHSITSTTAEPASAIAASGLSNLAIRNVTTLYWGTGVRFVDVTDSEISNVVTDRNLSDSTNAGYSARFNGIALLSGSDDNVLRGNEFYDAGRSGETSGSGNAVLVDSSHDNLIVDNTVNGPAFSGIRLWNADRNNLTGNTIEGNPYRRGSNAGIKIGSVSDGASDDNLLRENDVYGRTLFSPYDPGLVDGIAVLNGNGNVLVDNYVDETASEGIVVGTSDTTLVSNTINRAGEEGIAVYDPANVTDNTVTASGRDEEAAGIRVSSRADNTRLVGNDVRSTNGDGLSIDGVSGLLVENNSARFNGGWSVVLTSMPSEESVAGLTLGDLGPITATGSDFRLRPGSVSGVTLPAGEQDIGIAIEVEETSSGGSLRLEVGYTDGDVSGIDESTLSMWRYDGTWSEVAGTNGVNTAANVVFAEPSSFSQFVPLASNNPPTASLAASSNAVAPGESLTFDASGSTDPDGTIERYEWDVDGDGTVDRTTRTATITHSYASTGTYAATVTVVDNGDDNDSATVSVTVESKPIANLTTSPSPTSIDTNTAFDASASAFDGGTITSYRWDFDGDGTVDANTTAGTVNYTYPTPGNYTASITVVGDDGSTGSATASMTVRENLPPSGFGLSYGCTRGFSTYCENWVGDEVSFNAQTSSFPYTPTDPDGTIVEYRWDFDGDGTVDATTSSKSTSHTFDTAGTYTVTVTAVDDDGATNATTADVRIDPREYGTITGTITNASSGEAVPGVTVNLYQSPGQFQTLSNYTTTDENGTYEIRVLAVDHNVTVDPVGYEPASSVVTVTDGGTATADFGLTPDPNDTTRKTGTITGYTYDGESNNLDGVDVAVRNKTGLVASTTSGIVGGYSIDVPVGTYDVVFSKSGYAPVTELVSVTGNGTEYVYPKLENATTGGSGTPAQFDVTIDSTNAPITAGDTLTVTATVENTGGTVSTRTVTLSTGGVQRDTASVSLASGASETVSLTWATASGDAGNYTATVGTANDSASAPIRVLNTPASFEPTILETNSPVLNGSDFVVTAKVTNTGNLTATKTIKLISGGAGSNQTDITLAPGESTNVTLSVSTDTLTAGNYTLLFNTEDFTVDADLTVVDPAPASFEPTILETNSPVLNGSEFIVTAEVTNTGDLTAMKTIKLISGGAGSNQTDITLAPGESTNVTLSVSTDALTAGNYTLLFNTEDFTVDADLEVVDPAPASFEPTILETNSPVFNGSDFVVTAEVTNTGDLTATKTIKLISGGAGSNQTDITLAPGESTNVTLSVPTGALSIGDHTLLFNTEDFTVDADLTVVEPGQAFFDVTIDSTASPITAGETLNVTVTVENIGNVSGTRTVRLLANGSTVASRNLTLAAGAQQSVTLSWAATNDAAGNYTATVSTGDDSDTASVEIKSTDSSPVRTISPGQPGLGATVVIVALLATVLIGARRRP